MKIKWNTFVNIIVKIHYFLVKASKNNFCAQIEIFIINSFDIISVNNFLKKLNTSEIESNH